MNSDHQEARLDPERWVDQHGDYLYRHAYARLRNRDDAEEVVQQTFLAAFQHARQYRGTGVERAWLAGILKRKIIDGLRQRQRTPISTDTLHEDQFFDPRGNWKPTIRNSSQPPLDNIERQEFWQILQACLGNLSSRYADVFVLREIDEMSPEEICKQLQITPSNLWVMTHRARLQLTHCMKRRWQS